MVRGIRDAIRTADISSGRGVSATPLGPDPNPDVRPSAGGYAAPNFEPRVHVHPTPVYEARPVRLLDRYEPSCVGGLAVMPGVDPTVCLTVDAVTPTDPAERPIPPVWKQLPPVATGCPGRPRRVVKVVRQQPDIHHKGANVDIHI